MVPHQKNIDADDFIRVYSHSISFIPLVIVNLFLYLIYKFNFIASMHMKNWYACSFTHPLVSRPVLRFMKCQSFKCDGQGEGRKSFRSIGEVHLAASHILKVCSDKYTRAVNIVLFCTLVQWNLKYPSCFFCIQNAHA